MLISLRLFGFDVFQFHVGCPVYDEGGEFVSNTALDTELSDDEPVEIAYGFAGGTEHGRNGR